MKGKRAYIRNRIRRGTKYSPKELASCYGKIRFATYEEAKGAANALGSRAKAYKCQFGNHYHRGRKPGAKTY